MNEETALQVQVGVSRKDAIDGTELTRYGETSALAVAEHAKAIVQARYLVAINRPRNTENSRVKILETCRRPRFAEKARYAKPVGIKRVYGLSIRAADEFAKIFGNILVEQHVIFEDAEQRIIQISATDLETNLTKSQSLAVRKTVERKNARGREVIARRQNTSGELVSIVRATDDELLVKEASLCAKARRNLELQLIPADILEEAESLIQKTQSARDAKDPDAAKRAMIDAFARLGIEPGEIEKYLGHALSQVSPQQVNELRTIYTAIDQGETTWAEFLASKNEEEESRPTANGLEKPKRNKTKKPKKPEPKEWTPPTKPATTGEELDTSGLDVSEADAKLSMDDPPDATNGEELDTSGLDVPQSFF